MAFPLEDRSLRILSDISERSNSQWVDRRTEVSPIDTERKREAAGRGDKNWGAPGSKIFPRFTDTLDGSEDLLSHRIMNLVPIASNCQPPARYLPPERGEL